MVTRSGTASTSVSTVRELAVGGLLTALAIMIPFVFRGTLQIAIGPGYTATLASHVPSMLAMFVSPLAAVLVGLGSTAGFLVTLGPLVAARAFIHVIFGGVGALWFRRGWKPWVVVLAVLPIHAVGEGLVMLAFQGTAWWAWVTAGGTAVHHLMDGVITLALARALVRAGIRLQVRRDTGTPPHTFPHTAAGSGE